MREREGAAASVDAIITSPMVGEPGVFVSVGSIAWWVAISGALVALKNAGVGRSTLVLFGLGGLMAFHVPIGPPALVCLSIAAYAIERRRVPRRRHEVRRAYRIALAVVAVHVIDDSFLQPQPGTSAADHLVSGLGMLAALALAAWAYPRLQRRPARGARAAHRPVRACLGRRGHPLHDPGRRVR